MLVRVHWLVAVMTAVQAALGFLTLDLLFRYMNVEPTGLRARIGRYGLLYGLIAMTCAALGLGLEALVTGRAHVLAAAVYLTPWWLLWRFGWRKQFTHLFGPAERQPEDSGPNKDRPAQ